MASERLIIHGRVQGVGFRWWTVDLARRLRLRGWVRNRSAGTVEILAIGEADAIEALASACETGPPAARVVRVDRFAAEDDGSEEFTHRPTL